jgi:DNA ligase (NAD+)
VTTAKDLATHVTTVFDFVNKSIEELTQIEGVGPKVAQSLHDFFQNNGNVHLLNQLREIGVNTANRAEDSLAKNNKLEGKTFLFTGTLTRFTREQAKQLVEENGGKLLSGVSTNLNYLVAGADAGSKLSKAQKMPTVAIISEEDFLQLIA